MNTRQDILVIDDEPLIARAVEMICTAEGMTVAVAEDAARALQCVDESTFRLVLCDIMMNGLDGFQFLEELVSRGIDTPVVMMTGYSTVENAVRSLNTGSAIDYIPKPFTADELINVVRRSLRCGELMDSGGDDLSYIPCPGDYYRLGYISWVSLEAEGTAKIGINDLFVKSLGGISALEWFLPGEELVQGTPCATATAGNGTLHPVMCPMGGKIIEINERGQSTPSLVGKDPYFKGWLYRIVPTDPESDLKWLRL